MRRSNNDFKERRDIPVKVVSCGFIYTSFPLGILCVCDVMVQCPNLKHVDFTNNKLDNEAVIYFGMAYVTACSLCFFDSIDSLAC